uniref:Uncharacterized protein n=1 Tax=Rousettus aegyptiacus TaxID=9407 RepID=A0A7J8FI36_ROUAE|nr:hypothetical protein HJG63_011808 [Rousettus aegyptiacus]
MDVPACTGRNRARPINAVCGCESPQVSERHAARATAHGDGGPRDRGGCPCRTGNLGTARPGRRVLRPPPPTPPRRQGSAWCGREAAPRALCATGSEEPSALTLLETRMQTSWPSDPTARRGPP